MTACSRATVSLIMSVCPPTAYSECGLHECDDLYLLTTHRLGSSITISFIDVSIAGFELGCADADECLGHGMHMDGGHPDPATWNHTHGRMDRYRHGYVYVRTHQQIWTTRVAAIRRRRQHRHARGSGNSTDNTNLNTDTDTATYMYTDTDTDTATDTDTDTCTNPSMHALQRVSKSKLRRNRQAKEREGRCQAQMRSTIADMSDETHASGKGKAHILHA